MRDKCVAHDLSRLADGDGVAIRGRGNSETGDKTELGHLLGVHLHVEVVAPGCDLVAGYFEDACYW